MRNMSTHHIEQLLDAVMYYLPQDVRHQVMHEVPAAYNAYCGRTVIATVNEAAK